MLQIGFAPLLRLAVGIVTTRERIAVVLIVLDVGDAVGEEAKAIGESVECVVRDAVGHEILAKDELFMRKPHLCEEGGSKVGLAAIGIDESWGRDGAACPKHRDMIAERFVILDALGIAGVAVIW